MEPQAEGTVTFTAIHTKKDGTIIEYTGEPEPNSDGTYRVKQWIRKVVTNANSRGTD